MMPWRRVHWPVKILARLDAQIEVVTKAFVNLMPFAAKASIFGVWIMGLPAQPIASARWSSVSKKMMFGCLLAAARRSASSVSQPAKDNAAAMEPPAARDRNLRRSKFFILTPFLLFRQMVG
ncbi:hypothetical protein ES703_57356 [subsurface metagenome]